MRRALPAGVAFAVALLALAAGAVAASAQQAPLCRREGDRLVLWSLPEVLSRPEVARELEKGLTTSIVLRATVRDGRGHKERGRALVAVRYELWDRIYSLTWQGEAGERRQLPIPTSQALKDQWSLIELPVLEARELAEREPWRVHLELAVEPFSSAELEETALWLKRSPNTTEQGAAADLSGATKSTGGLSKLFDVLLPPIGRHTILELEWNLDCRAPMIVPVRTR